MAGAPGVGGAWAELAATRYLLAIGLAEGSTVSLGSSRDALTVDPRVAMGDLGNLQPPALGA